MKRPIALLLVLALTLSLLSFTGLAETEGSHEIEERQMTVYINNMDAYLEMPFYFMDGVSDMPWVELEVWADFMNTFFRDWDGDPNYHVDYAIDGHIISLTRENGYFMAFDFNERTIHFNDYNYFMQSSKDVTLVDMLSMKGYDDEGQPELFERNTKASYDRAGDVLILNLADYNIPMILQDGKGYVPFQTLGDFLIAPHTLCPTLFNGKAAFIADTEDTGNPTDGLTPLGEYYYSAEPTQRSEALMEYGYNELCMALDYIYGLSEIHDISSFDQIFWQIGYDQDLKNSDPETADVALYNFIDFYLDDLHSGFNGYSWMAGVRETDGSLGGSSRAYEDNYARYRNLRDSMLGEKPEPYTEVGNTAYITFDQFKSGAAGNYYTEREQGIFPDDTIGLICYAHQEIYRQDSPIENVVFDLSVNGGGSVNAALFLMAWVLGDISFSVKDTLTGALSNSVYRADVNLDRVFNSGDEVDDKHIFCLISPLSFSCGNLVPAVFKSSQRVTLLGRTSGGGSCIVQPMSTAWGSMFQISGSRRMSFMKNGSFYDIDTGVEPDVYITKLSDYYDREALTEFINSLF